MQCDAMSRHVMSYVIFAHATPMFQLIPLVEETIHSGHSVLIFASTKHHCESTARFIASHLAARKHSYHMQQHVRVQWQQARRRRECEVEAAKGQGDPMMRIHATAYTTPRKLQVEPVGTKGE